ncbi:MAG: hypothetical protein COA94_03040 [Rickettsiales bacterium]|nr:MAG: hypothetical protein COA94_03040 [Rickettsiales bacterium]
MVSVEYVMIVIVALIVLVLVGLLIYHFAFRKHGNIEGEPCSKDPCAAKHYCGGDTKCHSGISGGGSGMECSISAHCSSGLTCVDDKCGTGSSQDNHSGSFTNSSITAIIDGEKRYLTLSPATNDDDEAVSIWEKDEPNHKYSYSSSTNELSSSDSKLMVNSFGFIKEGPAAKFYFISSGGEMRMEDAFANILSLDTRDNTAVFKDPPRYTSQSTGPTVKGIVIKVDK